MEDFVTEFWNNHGICGKFLVIGAICAALLTAAVLIASPFALIEAAREGR
jgi:hypothetical protein